MNRRQCVATLAAAPAVLRAQRSRPNIIFLLSDDQRWDSLGCMGNRIVRTPNIDAIGRRGVIFTQNFVTTAICVSSRASIFTGLYTRCHGFWEFRQSFATESWARTYPMLLRGAGYRTGFIGKFGIDGGKAPVDQFDYWRGFQGQGRYFPKNDGKTHLTAIMGEQMLEFLRGCQSGQPFCLSVSFKAPHVQDEDPLQFLPDPQDLGLYADVHIPQPKTADPRYIQQLPLAVQRSEGRRRWAVRFATPALYQESVKNYYRLISGVDREVGRLQEELTRLGMADNTVILYSSDNGFYLGEHGLAGKWLMHEESIRTPLLIYDPRLPKDAGGRRVEQMTLNIDLAPTILDLAGVTVPASMQGRSLLPLVRGENVRWREEFFYEHDLLGNRWIPPTEGVRTRRWKYTLYTKEVPAFEELYDLEKDPLEEHNLAQAPQAAAQLERLRERRLLWLDRLKQWRADRAWQDPT